MSKPLRLSMPLTAAFIDDMREAFGADDIDAQIRAAIKDGAPTFRATEAGHEVGVRLPVPRVEISAADMVIGAYDPRKSKP